MIRLGNADVVVTFVDPAKTASGARLLRKPLHNP